MWVGLLGRLTIRVVIVCGLVAMLSTAAYMGFRDNALGRSYSCRSLAADYFGPTDLKLETYTPLPTATNPHPREIVDRQAIEHNHSVRCTQSAHAYLLKLVVFASLYGLGVAGGLLVVARLGRIALDPIKVVRRQPPTESLSDQLKRLASLRASGALTNDEFAAAKAAAIQRST
jgi:hypothetical protein